MSLKISLLVKLISFFCLLLNICSISCYSCNLPKDDITTMEEEVNLIEDKEDLKSQFKPLLDNLFLNRNSSILSKDSEGLKSFYNLDKKLVSGLMKMKQKKLNTFPTGVKNKALVLVGLILL